MSLKYYSYYTIFILMYYRRCNRQITPPVFNLRRYRYSRKFVPGVLLFGDVVFLSHQLSLISFIYLDKLKPKLHRSYYEKCV